MGVVLDCEVILKTELAVRVKFDNGFLQWIPKSVIDDGDQIELGQQEIEVRTWFCEKEGLE